MSGDTIWERGLTWPKSGPLHWLGIYCGVVSCAGIALWFLLSFVSPTAPDMACGKVYFVPGGRRVPDYYVDKLDAYALRIAAAHLGVVLVVGGAVGLLNAGAKRPRTLG